MRVERIVVAVDFSRHTFMGLLTGLFPSAGMLQKVCARA